MLHKVFRYISPVWYYFFNPSTTITNSPLGSLFVKWMINSGIVPCTVSSNILDNSRDTEILLSSPKIGKACSKNFSTRKGDSYKTVSYTHLDVYKRQLFITDSNWSYNVAYFFLGCVIVAGLYGAYSADKKIFFVQGVPAIIAMAAALLSKCCLWKKSIYFLGLPLL